MIPFAKMQAIGNDFVVVAESVLAAHDPPSLARALCERRFGVGADGLLAIGQGRGGAAFHFQMFNPDGTEDMCGNGMRCACLFAIRESLIAPTTTQFNVSSKDGIHACRLLSVNDNRSQAESQIDMGAPLFDPGSIPFVAAHDIVGADLPSFTHDSSFIHTTYKGYDLYPVNTGSTHAVIFVEAEPSGLVFETVSPALEIHPCFPERTSVLWAWPIGRRSYRIRIWERGAGETLGCGTGACAVAAVALKTKRQPFGEPITVSSSGGTLVLDWPSESSTLRMSGPAQFVFAGQYLAFS